MPIIKAQDLAYTRLRAPDLDIAEEFLIHFGMLKVERTATALYMRGTGPGHHIHITEKGEASVSGFAFYADNADDLERIATAPGASSVESIDEPGGGRRVCLTEPNGFRIEIVHGIATLPEIPIKTQVLNTAGEPNKRVGDLMRVHKGPARVKRIGHAVIGTPKVRETVRWFQEMVGLLCSDEIYAGDPANIIGSFNRCDRGTEYVDHHALFCLEHDTAGFNHFAFEVQDVDDVFMGGEYLTQLNKFRRLWGVGRHLLGSQVFDYWADPWSRGHEHWSDSDRLNALAAPGLYPVHEGLSSQWGGSAPEAFIHNLSR